MNLKIATLKARIIGLAETQKSFRRFANKKSGLDRHLLKSQAKETAREVRAALLAYGYLRGKTISQMESPESRSLVNIDAVTSMALAHFTPTPWQSGESWSTFHARQEAEVAALKARIREDLAAFNQAANRRLLDQSSGRESN